MGAQGVLEGRGGTPGLSDALQPRLGWADTRAAEQGPAHCGGPAETPGSAGGRLPDLALCSWQVEKAGTPSLKSSTPTSQGDAAAPGASAAPQFRPTPAKAPLDPLGELGRTGARGWLRGVVPPAPGPSCHLSPAALGLRNPLGVQTPYSAAFGMAHPAVNGDMAGTGAYASLHLVSPQLNGAAAAVGAGSYGRSPLVREPLAAGCGATGRERLSPAVPSRWATTPTPTCASRGWQPACKRGLRGSRKWGCAGVGVGGSSKA